MAIRSNHYDVAFEAYLRAIRVPYVSVDETRRALLQGTSLKSMDFIVHPPGGENLLVDVKGRRFPTESVSGRQLWKNWATEDDIRSLLRWEESFGDGFSATLVFAYHILGPEWEAQHEQCWEFRGRTYAFYGVSVRDYAALMKRCSPSWETVAVRADEFRELRTPFRQFLEQPDLSESTATSVA